MTHIETSRVNEALELQIASIRDHAARLSSADLESLEEHLDELEAAVEELHGVLDSLPHHREEHPVGQRVPPASPDTTGDNFDRAASVASDPSGRNPR